ncbi:diguanylate cyclase/phosphodiesterase (GGDEF & EAL domains) with PAS/PAC sensor(s) [hydrothermal vent metagenome]|uniref:Diguanylate cyclase/phosphodiesterase (GGDEF & EAL domains) with PAS/PAC sensor(S) n=1 Tax=hydrothermal vent metagenome TaxID=652676 RepID=A0A3B0X2K3_9ZZZZ
MKPEKKYFRIGDQFVIIIAIVIFLTLLSNAFIQYNNEKDRLYNNLLQQGNSIGKLLTSISIEPLLIYDNQTINDFAKNTTNQKNIVYTIYIDNKNNAITQYFDINNKDIIEIDSSIPIVIFNELKKNNNIIHLSFPIFFEKKILATLKIGLDKTHLKNIPYKNLTHKIYSSLIFGLIIGIGIYIGFQKKVCNPIKILNKSAHDIIKFNFDDQIKIKGNNELSELANTFNLMRTSLKEAVLGREKALYEMAKLNESLEIRVRERTNKLEDLNIQITHQSMHDPLTGLPNRNLIIDHLNKAIYYSQRNKSQFAVFILDLNNFKEINDTLGHPEGDIVLKEVSKRIPGALRKSDTIGRLGGDEFAFVLPDINEKNAIIVAQKIVDTLKPSFKLTTQSVEIGASIGISLYPIHGEDQSSLIRHADIAMYESKRHGNNVTFYNNNFNKYTSQRLALMTDLKKALENDELELHYQPQMHLKTHQIYGVEALLRWNHSEQGYIPPDQFIYIAENSGLINTLSDWVLNAALQQLKKWQKINLPLDISINISAKNLQDPTFPDKIFALINKHQVDPNYIKLEFTEGTIMSNPEVVLNLINYEKLKGIRYSIDDFGTGYSSLSYLKELTIDEVKIDKSFVFDMDESDKNTSIVKSIIDLTHNLGHIVVAEGVENENILQALNRLGCDSIQGYYISKAIPSTQIPEFVNNYNQH